MALRHIRRRLQLAAHIPGKVFVCRFPALLRTGGRSQRITEDHSPKICFDFVKLSGCSQKLRHKGQIHLTALPDGNSQGFARRLHTGYAGLRPDRPFREHIRFAFQRPVIIQVLQGAEQIVGRILFKCAGIGTGIDDPVGFGKAVIGSVQLPLFCCDHFLRIIFQLILDQLIHDLPKAQKSSHALFFLVGKLHVAHEGVFTEIYLTADQRIGIVLDGRISRNRINSFRFILQRHFRHGDLTMDMGDRFLQLIGQVCAGDRIDRQRFLPILRAFGTDLAQHHFRMLGKIAVDRKPVRCKPKVYPVRLNVDRPVALLEEDDIRHHVRPGIGTERIVGQTNRPQQLRAFRQILSDIRGLLIHGITAGDKSHNAARSHLIQRFGKEVVVNGESQLVIRLVRDTVVAKRDVADGKIIEIPLVRSFKTANCDIRVRIELSGNSPGNAVQLYAVQTAFLHFLRQHTEEVTDAHGRLQDITLRKTHLTDGLINCTNHGRTGVVGIQRGSPRHFVFFRREQLFQFVILTAPVILTVIKCIRKTTPADILRQHCLFLRRSVPVFFLQRPKQADCSHISLVFLLRTAFAQMVIGNPEILRRNLRCFGFFRYFGRPCIFLCQFTLHLRGFLTGNRFLCFFISGKALRIGHDLPDKRVTVQRVRIDQLAVDDAPAGQLFTNGCRVNIGEIIFIGIYALRQLLYRFRTKLRESVSRRGKRETACSFIAF